MFAIKKKRQHPEQDLCMCFVREIDALKAYGIIQSDLILIRLTLGASIGTTKNRVMAASIERAMGAHPGASDFLLVWRDKITGLPKILFLEAKIKGNYQQDNQKDFERKAKDAGCLYKIFHTVDEGLSQLKSSGVFFKQMG